MKATLAGAAAIGGIWHGSAAGAPARSRALPVTLVVLPAAAFGLYWLSALILAARNETFLFGADTILYMELAKGNVIARLGS
ncbi:MAG TPA: hypothetical protein VH913_19070, partial [Hyphomicrobiaceae bacterium]